MIDATEREVLERRIREQLEGGDKKGAATTLLEGYGREVLAFLISRLRDRDAAAEVFSHFTEELWKSLDTFRWQCPARVWAYALARHTASRHIEDAQRRRRRQVPLSRAGPLSAIEEKVRTATLSSMRTEARTRVAALRESLPAEDQMLVVLRVNRRLDWKEIAQVMTYDGQPASDAVLDKESARLRKRFQLVKERLQRMAVEQGLVKPGREG